MASSEVSMQDMGEVVVVTLPEAMNEELPSVVEEDKAVLVTAELTPQPREDVLTVTSVDADAETSTTDSLSKEEAVIDSGPRPRGSSLSRVTQTAISPSTSTSSGGIPRHSQASPEI